MNYINVKDLKAGQRFCEQVGGKAVWFVATEDAQDLKEPIYDGFGCHAKEDGTGEVCWFFQCRAGSPYGPHLYAEES